MMKFERVLNFGNSIPTPLSRLVQGIIHSIEHRKKGQLLDIKGCSIHSMRANALFPAKIAPFPRRDRLYPCP